MKKVAFRALAVAASLSFGGLTWSESSGQPDTFPLVDVQEAILDNGFRLLVVEDHRVPRISASLWYRFGAMQEPNGEHGEAHFLEHAIHQGTVTVGTTNFEAERPILQRIHETEEELLELWDLEKNQLRERDIFYDEVDWPSTPEIDALRAKLYELEDEDAKYREFWAEWLWYRRHGATKQHSDPVPATTGYERMEIDIDLPKESIELLFRLEADRMTNAVLRGWEAQRFTVLEQLLNRHSLPETNFYFAIDGVRGWGHLRDFAFFNRRSMLRLYDQYMVPNNTTLALVGDINLAEARRLAQRYFGQIPKGAPAPARMELEAEPASRGAARLDWAEPVDPRVIVRYRIPGVGHPDRPIFDVIAALLESRSGALRRKLTYDLDLVSDLDVTDQLIHTYRLGSPGALHIIAKGNRDQDLPLIESVILEVVEDLRRGSIGTEALERARKEMLLDWAQIRSSRSRLAYELGTFQVMDSWRTLQAHMEARQRASEDDVRRTAQKYFVPGNRLIATSRRSPSDPVSPVSVEGRQ
jgi:predicted Zn-dependent peptidase